jgi:hypothetical protein
VAAATAEFDGWAEHSDVRLRVALYQQRPGLLLQEFEGLVELE